MRVQPRLCCLPLQLFTCYSILLAFLAVASYVLMKEPKAAQEESAGAHLHEPLMRGAEEGEGALLTQSQSKHAGFLASLTFHLSFLLITFILQVTPPSLQAGKRTSPNSACMQSMVKSSCMPSLRTNGDPSAAGGLPSRRLPAPAVTGAGAK